MVAAGPSIGAENLTFHTSTDTFTQTLHDTRCPQSLNPKVQRSTPCASTITCDRQGWV